MPSLANPRRGHVLSTVAESYGQPIREAVSILARSFPKQACAAVYAQVFVQAPPSLPGSIARPPAELAAWSAVAAWVVAVGIKSLPIEASLTDAETWLSRSRCPSLLRLLPEEVILKAEAILRSQANQFAYLELMPYILDPHGPGSRLSVRRDPTTRAARARKKAEGVFYTPADVADFMAGSCLESVRENTSPTVLDPACGTGVFLRAALKKLRQSYPQRDVFSLAADCLFGTDIDPWAINAAAFVLTADTWSDASSASPLEIWRRLRANLACIDTLRIDPIEHKGRSASLEGDATRRFPISVIFPALTRGPAVVLGNPPYADLGNRPDLNELGETLQSIAAKCQPSAEVYLAFVEQMIRLADCRSCAGALVLPLSIACNVGPQFVAARELIGQTPGRWRFSFFDREPHALFGEDVKTRNAIVLWSKTPADLHARLATGPLRKWRGDSRAAMFKSLRFTGIESDIRPGIPKIEGEHQAAALKLLSVRWDRLANAVQSIERLNLKAAQDADDKTVFVGPTAYNFLNVFLTPPRDALRRDGHALSEHPLHAITCASSQDAFAVFAILSSHLAYWWWHAHSDGFHVSRRFIADLPFGVPVLAASTGGSLPKCGKALWNAIKSCPIISLNGGRTSLAYSPNGHDRIRRLADEALADLSGLTSAFVDELQKFTARSIAATLHENEATDTELEGT